VDTLLPPHPLHLATLGFLDNEIGIATLGYIVGPPIVVRFPADAIVQEMVWLARVDPMGDWLAAMQPNNWIAELDHKVFDLEGLFGSMTQRAIVEAHAEFEAIIQQADDLIGSVEVIEESAAVQPDGTVGAVEGDVAGATVQEVVPLGVVTETPGKGRC